MKQLLFRTALIALIIAALLGDTALAQEKKKTGKKIPTQEEMMKRYQEAMTPGESHKKLEAFVGSWDVETKIWTAGPNSVPIVSKGTAEYRMILGGRFLQQDFTGDMMGKKITGMGYTGYDNFKKKVVGIWIDDMGTCISTMEGSIDREGRTLTCYGRMDEPMTGEKNRKVKYVTRWVDSDTHIFESYDLSAYGDKKPTMQFTYTRKKQQEPPQ